ncbi:MAG: type IV pilus secretin PilQ [Deltaproteobacteria bacterium]|nr:type IV pilus secretin PilQ [Deltaproteobacteria bacterium]
MTGRNRSNRAVTLAAGLLVLAVAVTGMARANDVHMLSDVSVDEVDGATVVSLYGLEGATWEAATDPDGKTIWLRFEGVRPEFMPGNLVLNDSRVASVGFVEETSGSGEPRTVVAINGQIELDHDVVALGDRLEVRLVGRGGSTAATSGTTPTPVEEAVAEASAPASPLAATPLPAAPAPEPESVATVTTTATQLVGVDVEGTPGQTIVRMQTDGSVVKVKTFTLGDPPRLVIDLVGLTNKVRTSKIPLDLPHASRLRIGQHDGKVRIVLDGTENAPFGDRDIAVTERGVVLTIGDAASAASLASTLPPVASKPAEPVEAVRQAVEEEVEAEAIAADTTDTEPTLAATDPEPTLDTTDTEPTLATATTDSEPMAAESQPLEEVAEVADASNQPVMAPETVEAADGAEAADVAEAVQVSGVELESLPDRDRILIFTGEVREYALFEPDDETVVIRVLDAQIDDETAVRLIPPTGGPVSLVTAFQQPELATPEVRIVISRKAGAAPEIRQQGPLLMVDFAKTAEQMVDAMNEAPGLAEPLPLAATPLAPAPENVPAALAPLPESAVTAEPAILRIKEQVIGAGPAALDPDSAVAILQEGGFQEGKPYVGRRISLDFKDAEIDDVLRLVAEVSDLNVIAGDEVGGKVTIRLVDVPWDQALDVILMTQGLGFERVGNVLRIAPQDLLQAEREARMQERRAMEKLEDLIVKLQPVNYADVRDVSKLVKRLLSARGTVNTDERTSTLIMKDIPSVIDEATALIKAIDTQTPQVMIEAKIVEAQLDFSRELGSEWGAGSQPDSDFEDFQTGGIIPITVPGRGFPDSDANNVVVRNPISNVATGIVNLGSFLLNDRINVRLRLAAAESRGEGKVISSPRIVTLDNREAVIEQGVSIPFQTFENGDAALEFIDAVLSLRVRPHITADRSIIMKLNVSRNAPDDSVPTPTGSPAIAKNEATTETLVKDGQTLVIGGIYVVEKANRQSRVPILHRMPFVGAAFKNKSVRDIRKELLIFITPRIVQPQEVGT